MNRTASPVYNGLTQEEIEAQYHLRATRPDYQTSMIPEWIKRSALLRERSAGTLDIAYGPRGRNQLDYFPAPFQAKGFILYIHGGYWQRGDKSVYSFIAEPYIKNGFSVALMNYQMCPEVRLSEIAPQARLAVAWLWRNAKELGISRDNFNVMGHSAGGHLTTEMLFTDWQLEYPDLPNEFLHCGITLSGIYDFEPILYCSENKGLRLDFEEAIQVSPIYRKLRSRAPQLVGYGEREPSDMGRQSREYYQRFRTQTSEMELYAIPQADHFDVCNVIADERSELFSKCLGILNG
jgi:arylformamidase